MNRKAKANKLVNITGKCWRLALKTEDLNIAELYSETSNITLLIDIPVGNI